MRSRNVAIIWLVCSTIGVSKASSQEYPKALLVVSTFSEISLALTRAVDQHALGPRSTLYWNAYFSDNHFTISGEFDSETMKIMELSGYVWADTSGNVTVNYVGDVTTADERKIMASGSALWRFNSELGSHNELNIELVTRFGENTEWTWFKGAELVVGGAIGAAGAVGTTSVVTLGAGILASPWAAAAGFIGGSAAAISLSNEFVGKADSEEPPPEPMDPPVRPEMPAPDSDVLIGGGQMVVVVSSDGALFGATPSADYVMSGTYSLASGSADGSVFTAQ